MRTWLAFALCCAALSCDTTTPVGGGMADPRCLSGVDTDQDGISDDLECVQMTDPTRADTDGDGLLDNEERRIGTDPTRADTDGDRISDGVEVRYPRLCAAADPLKQRRPPVPCQGDAECGAGERCQGLDPLKADSDGDGVPDVEEDQNQDGVITVLTGETDPRLPDSDGDGKPDLVAGSRVCRSDGLGRVVQVPLPRAAFQLGHDPTFGAARVLRGLQERSVALLDDAQSDVAALVADAPQGGADVVADATRAQTAAVDALVKPGGVAVTSVLLGRPFRTHESNDAISASYRVTSTSATSASALRDRLALGLAGATAEGGPVIGAGQEFLLDITTVRRGGGDDLILTVVPRASYEDTGKASAIRAGDLLNATGVAGNRQTLDHRCQGVVTERLPVADFLWVVDTSSSMNDDQERLGNTATAFFNRMNAAGVDFRVGVFRSGSTSVNLQTPGFQFIGAASADGPRTLCRTVTRGSCPGDTMDTLAPYAVAGGSETPTAGAVVINEEFKRRAAAGEVNASWQWRKDATRVAFLVTDEPTDDQAAQANDWLYFKNANIPGTSTRWAPSGTYDQSVLSGIVKYYQDNRILAFGMLPLNSADNPRACSAADARDLPRCVVSGTGGAYINIKTALDAEVALAMDRIVDAAAGAASTFKLERSPITHTIRVNVRGVDVPRSRRAGFDYDPASRSIVFYGREHRPAVGDTVYLSYRVWQESPG